MKKFAKIISCIALVSLSGSAFARPNTGSSTLDEVIANTDAQLASAMAGAAELSLLTRSGRSRPPRGPKRPIMSGFRI